MEIQTRDFGSLHINIDEIVEFEEPIFGFDDLKKYVLLSDDEAGDGVMWLQSIEISNVCFILIDPALLPHAYTPTIPASIHKKLMLQGNTAIRLIAVVPENFKDTTVNLKSPIVINQDNKKAAQVILEEDYPIRFKLFGKEGETC